MLQQVLISLGFIVIQILVNGFGTDCIAAFISASRIDSLRRIAIHKFRTGVDDFYSPKLWSKKNG